MELSIIIINYNTFDLTTKCIESVFRHTRGIAFEVILVDNASVECDASLFKERFPSIILIKSETNVGFARGNNLGLQQATGKYILLLNSDIELIENSIKICLDYLKANDKIGVISPMLIYPDGKIQKIANRFPSVSYECIELFRLHKFLLPRNYLLGYYFDHKSNKEADWVWGAFFLTSRANIDKFPGHKLPDKYFMYFEDVVWCYAIKKMGFKVQYIADTKAVHYLSASSQPSKDLNWKKNEKICANEIDFWVTEKGKAYGVLLFLLRALKFFSLRTRKDVQLAKFYLKNIAKIIHYKP